MSFLERVSLGDLSCLQDIPDDDSQLPVLLYAIPDTINLDSIKGVLRAKLEDHSVWLINRGVQIEKNTGNVDEAIQCFQHSKHPLAKKLIMEYSCFKLVLEFFATEPDIHRRLTFSRLHSELLKVDPLVLVELSLFLVQRGFVLSSIFDVVFQSKLAPSNNLMEEIF